MPLIATEAARLLGAIADALNSAERQGIPVDLEHGAVMTRFGYVVPSGDGRIGNRWAVRTRLWPAEPPDSGDGD